MRAPWFAPSLAVLVALAPPARAQTNHARSELERGYELRRQSNYVEALPHLLESYRLDPQLKTLLNLADSEEHIGKLVDARVHWRKALAQAGAQKDADVRKEAEKRIAALDKRIPTLAIKLAPSAPPGSVVELDGLTLGPNDVGVANPADPGRRAIVVRAPGREDRHSEVILETEETREVVVEPGPELAKAAAPAPPPQPPVTVSPPPPPEPAPPASSSPLTYVGVTLTGLGVAGLAVGTVFGVTALTKRNDADCPNNVCTGPSGQPSTLHQAVSAGNVSTAFFIAGSVLVAGGATLWIVAPRRNRGAALLASPVVASHAGGAALIGTW